MGSPLGPLGHAGALPDRRSLKKIGGIVPERPFKEFEFSLVSAMFAPKAGAESLRSGTTASGRRIRGMIGEKFRFPGNKRLGLF